MIINKFLTLIHFHCLLVCPECDSRIFDDVLYKPACCDESFHESCFFRYYKNNRKCPSCGQIKIKGSMLFLG